MTLTSGDLSEIRDSLMNEKQLPINIIVNFLGGDTGDSCCYSFDFSGGDHVTPEGHLYCLGPEGDGLMLRFTLIAGPSISRVRFPRNPTDSGDPVALIAGLVRVDVDGIPTGCPRTHDRMEFGAVQVGANRNWARFRNRKRNSGRPLGYRLCARVTHLDERQKSNIELDPRIINR
jgi:hypothetical protein